MTGRPRMLVTGGLGFLGRRIVARALEAGGEALAVDLRDDDTTEGLPARRADVRDLAAMTAAIEDFRADVVVHAAALVPSSPADEVWSANAEGTRVVLEAARRASVQRVVFVSSAATYALDGPPFRDESAPTAPEGVYARAKVEAERWCAEYRTRHGMVVPVLRPVPIIGPGRRGVFHFLFEWVSEGRAIPFLGDGRNRVQLVHVDDCCAAVEATLAAPAERANTVFNVGAVAVGTVRDDLRALCAAAGTGARPVGVPRVLIEPALLRAHRMGLSPLYPWMLMAASREMSFSVERLRALGWSPRYANADTLVDAWRAHDAVRGKVAVGVGTDHLRPWRGGLIDWIRRIA